MALYWSEDRLSALQIHDREIRGKTMFTLCDVREAFPGSGRPLPYSPA
jgi:hypothetical protein